jgi:NAD(P)-dependent dehydrogenase (short-subunit alcohol dehydrogenase family)
MELAGKVAVVTGAASGIGLASCRRFLADGMSVAMADIEVPVLAQRSEELAREHPDRVLAVPTDVADARQVRALKEAANEAFGPVQVLCNNAGVATGRATWKTRPEVWDWEVGVNLLGVGYGVHTFVPDMVAAGEGHVVNTASEAGLHAGFGLGVYHATKYGVVGLSEALAGELRGTGVGVTCVCPELVDTLVFESTRNAPAGLGLGPPRHVPMADLEALMATTAMPPSEVAELVAAAIVEQRFWVITHAATVPRVRARDAALEDAIAAATRTGAGS